jgi:molybdopterin molybdotransferase
MPPNAMHQMVPVPEAIRIVLQETARLLLLLREDDEEIATHDFARLHGRVVQHSVRMREPGYPPYAASVMDGYAISSSSSSSSIEGEETSDSWTHCIVGKVHAGDEKPAQEYPERPKVNLPVAYYVTTGALIPENCDCVIPIEEVLSISDDQTRIRLSFLNMAANKWIRAPGSDIAAGTILVEAGSILDPIALGRVLQSGASTVRVRRRVTVGVVSTGNELWQRQDSVRPDAAAAAAAQPADDWWASLDPGKIPDVNRPVLLSLLSSIPNVDIVDLGMVSDNATETDGEAMELEQVLRAALDTCSVIVTTGGISQGASDFVEHVLVDRLGGQLHFGRLHMKPGKPTTFVTIAAAAHQSSTTTTTSPQPRLVFALPGNPVSAIVCTHLLVRPCLNLLIHGSTAPLADIPATNNVLLEQAIQQTVQHAPVHSEVMAELTHDIKLDFERPEYHRVVMVEPASSSANEPVRVASTGVQQSSRLLSLRDAHGLLVLPQATDQHPIATAGESFTLLQCLDPESVRRPLSLPVEASKHLKRIRKPPPPLSVGVVLIAPDHPADQTLSTRVEAALNGSKPGSATVQSVRIYSDLVDRFYGSITEDNVDVLVVACLKLPGSFRHYVKLANLMRRNLSKVANAMALLARRGAADQDSATAIFEVVIGYRTQGKGSIVILVPEEGLDSALSNIHGLLRHALQIARNGSGHDHKEPSTTSSAIESSSPPEHPPQQ